MTTLFSRCALTSSVALALLAACGGSQPPISTPGSVPQSRTVTGRADHSRSWMLPEARADDLVYTNDGVNVYVLSFPQGKLVGTLAGFDGAYGECSDESGDIWITNTSPPEVIEYAHGSTTPKTMLPLNAGAEPSGCALDPISGNLAVTIYYPSAIAIFPNASGTARYYSDPDIGGWGFCAYDRNGDLFAESKRSQLAELPVGGGSLQTISLDKEIGVGSIQWVGSYLAVASSPGGPPRAHKRRTRLHLGSYRHHHCENSIAQRAGPRSAS